MKKYFKVNYRIIFILVFFPITIMASVDSYKRDIHWMGVQRVQLNEKQTMQVICFDKAMYENQNEKVPTYFERFRLSDGSDQVKANLKNEVYEQCTNEESAILNNSLAISNVIELKSAIYVEQKVSYVGISFYPFRKNSINGKFEKLKSFEIVITSSPKYFTKSTKRSYKNTSVLATGDWYKISCRNTGVHRLTYNDLLTLGMDMASVNSQNIRIYGNGAGMLPEANATFRYDDLQENAIQVVDGGDGKFDPGDYILFYAQGPTTWAYQASEKHFRHSVNPYASETFYFVTADLGPGKRITSISSTSAPATHFVTKFNDYICHQLELVNFIKSGREWFGETFDLVTTYNYSFVFPDLDLASKVHVRNSVAARSDVVSTFVTNANGNTITSTIPSVALAYNGAYAAVVSDTLSFFSTNSSVSVSLNYNKSTSNSIGWLQYLELNAIRNLHFSGSQLLFRNASCAGSGNISEYTLTNAPSQVLIWEVTNPINVRKINTTLISSQQVFRLPTDSIIEFVAFDGSSFLVPQLVGSVENQNLHGLGQYDMIIVSHPNFASEAQQLASLHYTNDNLSVLVVSTQAIFNEYSSGVSDPTGIRDFVKMFYDRANTLSEQPKYLLLFGDGSYDGKTRLATNTNYIPTYQSQNSLDPTTSYVTDDYFGLLDDSEGQGANGAIDIGIGRFPIQSKEEAQVAFNKIERYTKKLISVSQSSSSYSSTIPNMSDWRNVVCFVADDEDGNLHLTQAEGLADYINTNYKDYNIDKIYFDAYTQVATPGGQRYPEVTEAINKRVAKGALIINYTGHGGELGWAHERVLEVSDINSWTNENNMPVFVTATCEFSRFDDPERTSAGELVFLNPNGGGAGLFTTTRLAFAHANYALNYSFYTFAFQQTGDSYYRMGDLIKLSKNDRGNQDNIKNFVLLSDPALQLSYPKYNVVTTSINNKSVSGIADTIKALSKVTVQGVIQDAQGNKLTGYNGVIYPTVFDKSAEITTRGNDGGSSPVIFKLQKNVLYKGKASVTNGEFTFTFIVPKDIAYKYGVGKISYYAQNGSVDANGYYDNLVIGGSETNVPTDLSGPEIKLFLNDEHFVFGGITNESPMLLAIVNDTNGVNTIGSGIGHDIVAILDDNTENSLVLNDYYESDLDSYQSGVIRYPFSSLTEGTHTLKLKVWDVYNNSSDAYTEFVVTKSSDLTLSHVLNYPNPFTTHTSFYFEHNQPNITLDVQIQIFSVSGKLVKTIDSYMFTNGFRSDPIEWNARDDYGDKLARGVYIYKIKVRSNNDTYSEKTDKLVIL